ncbi:hypothetical protein GNZ25_27275 [Burkholderia thailandensis]|nr:hypothetical protein A8H31_09690 [Burkholderia thailandensis]AWY62594.1 hypothetical protein A8H35_21860 [Burkholderia thailandensis]AWY66113.1 hypothetical protein A8H36_06925 [Burkholderia thailandensis]MUV24953.1 hypothetical protein [Burkholderia thailandensis]NBC92516.1 hypothetical protein [Burkholderia thailandensis]
MKRLLLLSGAMRAGKSSVAHALKENYSFSGISSGGYLRTCGKPDAVLNLRSWLQETGDQLDIETDFAWVVDSVAVPAIAASPSVENWLFDAVRKPRQIEHFRARFGQIVRHVHLSASEDILRERYAVGAAPSGAAAYVTAITHANEIAARSLGTIADEIFDTTTVTANDIAAQIIDAWPGGNA